MKKTTKPLIFLIVFASLFISTFAMCLGFSLHNIEEPKLTVTQVNVQRVYKNSYDFCTIDVEVSYTTNSSFNARLSVRVYEKETNEYVNYSAKNIKSTKKSSSKAVFLIEIGYFDPLPSAELYTLTTNVSNIEKITTQFNYVGYALAPVSALLAGFTAYSIADFIKAQKKENQD